MLLFKEIVFRKKKVLTLVRSKHLLNMLFIIVINIKYCQ